jgi:hypothetical protein
MTTFFSSLIVVAALVSGQDAGRLFEPGADDSIAVQPSAQAATAIRQRVEEGQKVRITDEQGREWKGRIAELAADTLVLAGGGRQRREVPYGTIVKIDRPHDSLVNGALIGLLSGAVFGLVAAAAEESDGCEPSGPFGCGDVTNVAYVIAPLVFGGLGAGIGVGIDALIKSDPNLYRRGDAPVAQGHSVGLRVSVRW